MTDSSSVKNTHPKFQRELYQLMSDCYDGWDAIKGKGETYLPMTSGQRSWNNEVGCDSSTSESPYGAYKERAEVPDLIGPAIRGFSGVAHRKEGIVEVPSRLEYILEDVGNGKDIHSFAKSVTETVLQYSRRPVLVDWNADYMGKARSVFVPYSPSAMYNWKVDTIYGEEIARLVCFQESFEADDLGMFSHNSRDRARVLYLEDGRYKVAIHNADESGGTYIVEEMPDPTLQIGRIPVVVAGSTEVGFDNDIIPMLGIARNQIKYYQISADYYQSLFMSAVSTPFISGVDPDRFEIILGSEVGMVASDPNAKAIFLETDGNGIEANRNAMKDQLLAAMENGHKLIDSSGQESGAALKTRVDSKTATLRSVILAEQQAITQCLKYAAQWENLDPESVSYEANLEFVEKDIDPQLLNVLNAMVMSGNMPKELMWDHLQESGFTSRNIDEIEALIEEGSGMFETPVQTPLQTNQNQI